MCGSTSVGNLVFHFHWHLGESLVEAVREEDRVVAEALFSVLFFGDNAFYFSFKEILSPVEVKSYYCFEASLAVFDAF